MSPEVPLLGIYPREMKDSIHKKPNTKNICHTFSRVVVPFRTTHDVDELLVAPQPHQYWVLSAC